MNPAPMDGVAKSLPLGLFSMVIVNEVEALDLTGESSTDAMLQAMHQRMPNTTVVLTLGSEGAIWLDANKHIHVPARTVSVVDTTGAGDTFTGYLLASLVQGMVAEAAMRRTVRAAALCVTQAGAADSIPLASSVDADELA